jgi:hypothetical protein
LKLFNLCFDLFHVADKPVVSDKLAEFFGEPKGKKRETLGQEMLAFLNGKKIDLAVGLSRAQEDLPLPQYEVRLFKDGAEESFLVMGNPEDGRRILPEDAIRALHTRIQMYELGECLHSAFDSTCSETASRLRSFFGSRNYFDFLNLGNMRKAGMF